MALPFPACPSVWQVSVQTRRCLQGLSLTSSASASCPRTRWMQPMLKQILAGGCWTAVKASRAARHSFPSAAHTPSCHRRIVSTRDMARWQRDAGSPGPSSQRCSASLCPLSASAFVSQNCQEVASLASPQAAPPWGSGAEAAVPQWVSTPSCRGLRDRSSSGFASLGFLMILSAARLSSSNLGLQSQSS